MVEWKGKLIDEGTQGALWIAAERGHVEAGVILAKKRALCPAAEKAELDEKYTDFLLFLQQEAQKDEERRTAETNQEGTVKRITLEIQNKRSSSTTKKLCKPANLLSSNES